MKNTYGYAAYLVQFYITSVKLPLPVVMIKTTAVISYLPFLLLSGCIAGAFTGVCA